MIVFIATELYELKELREEYFTEIKLSQELFLEWAVADGLCFKIADSGNEIGYFIKSPDNMLLEFYLKYENLTCKEDIFGEIIKQHSITSALCKTFDYITMTCCHSFCKSSKIKGTIFRDYSTDITFGLEIDVNVRLATEHDIPLLEMQKSDLYETVDELYYMVKNRNMYMFEKGEILIACGFLIQILPDKNYYDIGMWTNPGYRRKTYAKQVISYLKKHCFNYNYIPVCGCAADNTASRKALEANGFVSKYSIILFEL